MQLGYIGHLLLAGFPHSLAHRLQHDSGHFFPSCRILLLEIFMQAQAELILYVHIIYLIPHFLIDSFGLHHIPAICVLYNLGKCIRSTCFSFHFLLDIGRVEDSRTALHSDSLLDLLHAEVVAIAVIAQISIRVFSRHITNSQVEPAHKLVHVVEAQCSPRIALARLYNRIRTCQRSFESELTEGFPVLFTTIVSTHIIQIGICYFFLAFPTVTAHHHTLDTGSITAVSSSEHAKCRNLPGIFRSQAFFYQHPFCFDHSGSNLIFVLVVFCMGSHFNRSVNKEQAGSCDVPQLPARLYYHIDTRASQFFRGDEFQIRNTAESIPQRFHTQHIEYLGDSGSFRLDELAAPQRIAYFTGNAIIVPAFIHLDCIICQLYAFLPCRLAWGSLCIDSVEVASGRQGIGIYYRIASR